MSATKRQLEDTRDGSEEAGPSTLPATSTSTGGPVAKKVKKKAKRDIAPGIIYISRLPPGMTPQKVRHLMARWGDIGKVYAQRKDGEYLPLASISSADTRLYLSRV
jgi:ESF2/ABP1 family protein